MNILAIETSSQACSVTLNLDGVINRKHEVLNNQHSDYLLSFVDELLALASIKKSHLDAIAVGNGPGSFTGLRLGLGVAQGLAYGLNKPLIPISSLLSIAAQSDQNHLLVAVDARMGEVYWQCLEKDNLNCVELTEPKLNKPANISLPKINDDWYGIGSGWDVYADQLQRYLTNSNNYAVGVLPDSAVVAQLAQIIVERGEIDLNQEVLPAYVRNKVTN